MDLKILDYLTGGVLFITPDKKIGYINKKAEKQINKKVGDSCYGLFSTCRENCPIDNGSLKKFSNFNVKLLCCNKSICHNITPIFENGKFIGLIEEFRDSSQIDEYIKELKEQNEFIDTILNSVVDAIIVVDKEGYILHYNEAAKNYLCRDVEDLRGFNIKELLGKSLEELPEEGRREDIEIETLAMGKIKVSLFNTNLKNKNGKLISFYVLPECMLNTNSKGFIITKNPKFLSILDMVKTVADTTANVLIEGETGTGKSILAKYIHTLSSRRNKPFVKINCASIPESLLESELFGYVKGAFTGAYKDKPGKVEVADGGTLFLDEIGDMPLYLQSKLLHLIQEKEFERVGDVKTRKVNIRIIAATNKDLKKLVEEGKFREDLYYRLKVIYLKVPSLRERREDIPVLVNHFINKFSQEYKRNIKGISPNAMKYLLDYNYPGNIRELENIIERAVIVCDKGYIEEKDLPQEVLENTNLNYDEKIKTDAHQSETISEKEKIKLALMKANGNKTLAAKILGIHRTTLWRKLKEYHL